MSKARIDSHKDAAAEVKGGENQSVLRNTNILDERDVRRVFDQYETGATAKDIAAELGVCVATIGNILAGRSWKHLYRFVPGHGYARGSSIHSAKLDEVKAEKIRAEAAAGVVVKELVARHGVNETTIWHVLKGDTWTHVVGYAGPITPARPYKRSSDEDVRRMRERARGGVPLTALARESGEDIGHVCRIIHGLFRRDAGGPIKVGKGAAAHWVETEVTAVGPTWSDPTLVEAARRDLALVEAALCGLALVEALEAPDADLRRSAADGPFVARACRVHAALARALAIPNRPLRVERLRTRLARLTDGALAVARQLGVRCTIECKFNPRDVASRRFVLVEFRLATRWRETTVRAFSDDEPATIRERLAAAVRSLQKEPSRRRRRP
jgi:hypothetical protein